MPDRNQYSHVLDIAFEVATDEEDPRDIPGKYILAALMRRISSMLDGQPENNLTNTGQFCVGEAVGHCSTYEDKCIKRVERKDCRLEGRFND